MGMSDTVTSIECLWVRVEREWGGCEAVFGERGRVGKKASIVVHSKQREMTQERRMDHREPTVKSSLLYSLS